jgi:hypothetical protein
MMILIYTVGVIDMSQPNYDVGQPSAGHGISGLGPAAIVDTLHQIDTNIDHCGPLLTTIQSKVFRKRCTHSLYKSNPSIRFLGKTVHGLHWNLISPLNDLGLAILLNAIETRYLDTIHYYFYHVNECWQFVRKYFVHSTFQRKGFLVAVNLSSWDFVSWEESGEWSG